MAYILQSFDGLQIPTYLDDGDSQNMGTGNALTNFTQLAGGGFFDNYGTTVSPQGIRPITKSCVIWGDDAQETREIIDAWRARIGKRGKLTVKFDDGSLRWQWARLQDFDAPRDQSVKGNWAPVQMSWITADQSWRGVIASELEWNWGDNTWTFGDGTAEFGEQDQSYPITASPLNVTLTNNGNINSTNLRFSLTPDIDLTLLQLINVTTNTTLALPGFPLAADEEIVIDCGAMSVTIDGVDAYANFVRTSAGHWLPLIPGENDIRVTYLSASGTMHSTVNFSFYDYYA